MIVEFTLSVLKIIAHLEFEICFTKNYYFHLTTIKDKSIQNLFTKNNIVSEFFSQKTKGIFVISHHALVGVFGLIIAFFFWGESMHITQMLKTISLF